MSGSVKRVVIVGGGTAGWLAAARIAAAARPGALDVTLIEAPDIPTIGVGEGTWPTMRRTLSRIGIAEAEFLTACDASFKQGSRFICWRDGTDAYHHPFTPPIEGSAAALMAGWRGEGAFADAVCAQPAVADRALAPRQPAMPDYAGAVNYAYHLDAGKFAGVLRRHATERLGVVHIADHVERVVPGEDATIAAVATRAHGEVAGDLFIDCTGHAALLIGGHFGVPFVDWSDVLFNDRALAVQVPVAPGSPVTAVTDATAHEAGWIWDIGLPTRRGVGCVYASAHMSDDRAAAVLTDYLRRTAPDCDPAALSFRQLQFRSGHRERFWAGNCLAIGLSAGFLEPLEASAIVLIELSLDALVEDFPADHAAMAGAAARFNVRFRQRWDRIVAFLKLHYVLSERTEPYWQAHRDPASIPADLAAMLTRWRHRAPMPSDFDAVDELFPAASHQYVLYGMGAPVPPPPAMRVEDEAAVAERMAQLRQRVRTLTASLPTNRTYLDNLAARPLLREAR
ncbi:tryptophan halogenase family protein [uncultured Sphingomonas sp.]|uniref:tryptophan halogenase family protein n=1 Tax=uncultured Sphingomonas sp. TaxID=158754 RepID=UPI0025CCE419|nr:tryptophan halogenase family protein [uncultured Sphingomonas sp.]